ncbi:hypothetical protein C3L33_10449, partial [Rhododendron williamsianum]
MQSTEDCYYYPENQLESGGFQSGTINRLKMLTLNNASPFPATTTTAPPLPSSAAATRCTTCRGSSSSTKRRSPSSSFLLQEPSAKKQLLTLLSPPPSAAAKLPTPINTQITPPSPAAILRRCISDPVNSPGTTALLSNPQSPENANTIVSATTPSPGKGTASLPPLPRALRRSISDPLSHSPSSGELGSGSRNRGGESPGSMSLKTLKERMSEMREMIQWWEKIVGEEGEEEDNNGRGNHDIGTITEVECAAETETEEEAVSVERTGECLVLHFKCPCTKGYQILLSGNNCYYKLM